MYISPTDYTRYPTIASLSENDIQTFYQKPLTDHEGQELVRKQSGTEEEKPKKKSKIWIILIVVILAYITLKGNWVYIIMNLAILGWPLLLIVLACGAFFIYRKMKKNSSEKIEGKPADERIEDSSEKKSE